MRKAVTTACCLSVALLTEGVDRNEMYGEVCAFL